MTGADAEADRAPDGTQVTAQDEESSVDIRAPDVSVSNCTQDIQEKQNGSMLPAEDSNTQSAEPVFKVPAPKGSMLPPPAKKMLPPVPKFPGKAMVDPGANTVDIQERERLAADAKAKASALDHARRAALHVTPAQREKAIAEAAAAAAAAYTASKSQNRGLESSTSASGQAEGAGDPAKGVPLYTQPDWGGAPRGVQFSLETMKSGQIIGQQSLDQKSYYTFGRAPACDFFLEHPTISRLHAVLQFRAEDSSPLLYDAGSTHGTFLNKRRIKPKVYAPLSVGDILKFGQSSRLFILGGPAELMPEEGLTRSQRQTLKALEAKEKRKEREQQIAKAQMAAALNRGISWGMGEDAVADDDDENGVRPTVDWRAYAQTHSLTDHQQKLADKLRRLENRIRNLTTEAERIRAKQGSLEDMTAGQAAQLALNERIIDEATEECEDLEEMLNEAIADSLRGQKKSLEVQASKTRRRKRGEDEDAESGSSEEDDFYDRTAPGKFKKQKDAAVVHTASSLYGRKEALLEERKKVQQQLEEELESNPRDRPASANGGEPAGTAAECQQQQDSEAAADPLDAFMTDVAVQLELSKVNKLRKTIADLDAETASLEKLLRQADPDNYYKPGTHAARVAREKGLRLYNQDQEKKAALELKKRQDAAARAAEAAAAQIFVPETEEEEVTEPPPSQSAAANGTAAMAQKQQKDELNMVHRLEVQDGTTGGLEIRKSTQSPKAKSVAAFAPSQQAAAALPDRASPQEAAQKTAQEVPQEQYGLQTGASAKQKRDAMIKAALAKEAAEKKAAAASTGTGRPAAEDAVLADLALLRNAGRADGSDNAEGVEKVNIEETGWQPPVGQSGDGKTLLNEKLGY